MRMVPSFSPNETLLSYFQHHAFDKKAALCFDNSVGKSYPFAAVLLQQPTIVKGKKAARHPRGRGQASVNRKEGCGVRPAKPSVWRVALPLRPYVYSVHDQCGCEFMDQFSLRGGHTAPGTGTRRFLKGRNAQISYDFARILRMAHDNPCAFLQKCIDCLGFTANRKEVVDNYLLYFFSSGTGLKKCGSIWTCGSAKFP